MVVRLDLEGDRLAVAEVNHSGVFSGALQDTRAGSRESFEEGRGMLVAAVLRPQQREDRELEVIRFPLEQFADARELLVGETERPVERLFEDPRQRIECNQ